MKTDRVQELINEMKEKKDVLDNIRAIMLTNEGMKFIEYLIKNLMIGHFPEPGLKGEELHETLGALRAGRSVYELLVQADAKTVATIIAKIEDERISSIERTLKEELEKQEKQNEYPY